GRGVDRLHVVRIAGLADGQREDVLGAAVLGGGDELLEGTGLRDVGELVVGEQREGLHRVGHAVGLAVVGDGVDADRGDRVRHVGGQLHRGDRPVLDEVADPVVGAHGDVRTVAGLVGGDEVRLQFVTGDDLHDDLDAVLLAPRLRGGLQRRGLLLVGPDDQLPGRRAAAAVGGAAAPGVAVGVRVRAAAG